MLPRGAIHSTTRQEAAQMRMAEIECDNHAIRCAIVFWIKKRVPEMRIVLRAGNKKMPEMGQVQAKSRQESFGLR